MKNTYKENDCGAMGKTTEKAVKAFLKLKVKVSAPGRYDFVKAHTAIEVKTGAGELGNKGEKILKGCTKVLYVPVVDMDKPIERQEGFLVERDTFLAVLEECGLIREKTATSGVEKITIQTFWNHSKNAPHGTAYYKLIDRLYEACEMTLDEYLAQY